MYAPTPSYPKWRANLNKQLSVANLGVRKLLKFVWDKRSFLSHRSSSDFAHTQVVLPRVTGNSDNPSIHRLFVMSPAQCMASSLGVESRQPSTETVAATKYFDELSFELVERTFSFLDMEQGYWRTILCLWLRSALLDNGSWTKLRKP